MKNCNRLALSLAIALAAMRSLAGIFDNPNAVFEHFPNVNVDAHMLRVAKAHFADIREGRIPSDTNELAKAQILPSLQWNTASDSQIARWFRETLHAWAIGGEPVKEWRISNKIDIWRWAGFRSDAFWTSQHLGSRDGEMNPLIAGLRRLDPNCQWDYQDGYEQNADGSQDWNRPRYAYRVPTNSYEVLKRICSEDACARDVIVGIGLVCKDLSLAKRVAMELAPCSEVNWPIYALRIPVEDARRILGGHKQYARLLSNLEIRAMVPGMARYDAIVRHMSQFPDYTEEDMPRTSVALNTNEELGAIAGYELAIAGRYRDALALWLDRGGCPEDVALVSEQILSLEELKKLIDEHPWKPKTTLRPRMSKMWSVYCSHNEGSGRYLITHSSDAMRAYVRTIYAKRLMRAGRYNEAVDYFHKSDDYVLAKRFLHLQKMFTCANPLSPIQNDIYCGLTLGALMRQGADRLFGTELEPDNMICDGRYACEWAVSNTVLASARKIPEKRRYHYRWRTADVYKRTGDLAGKMPGLEEQRRVQGFCYWMRGLILRYRDPSLAFEDYAFVRKETPDLIGKFIFAHWEGVAVTNESYQVAAKVQSPYKDWMRKDDWLQDNLLLQYSDVMPHVKPVPLPPHEDTCDDLVQLGRKLFKGVSREDAFSECGYPASLYAFYLAGRKGSAYGYARCCAYYMDALGDYGQAAPFLKAANKCDSTIPVVRYYNARMKMAVGLGHDAYNEIKSLADADWSDIEIGQFAVRAMISFSTYGYLDVEPDEGLEARYRQRLGAGNEAERE